MSRYVSDLKWIVSAPDIVNLKEYSHDCIHHDLSWLDSALEEKLFEFMQSKNRFMLGTYYEALWEFYIQNHPDCDLIGRNIQINDKIESKGVVKKVTIGEMDFIYWQKQSQKMIHLEVAIKYYLEVDQQVIGEKYSCWIGPKCNDRLDIKYNKLINHQVCLTSKSATQQKIKPLINQSKINAKAILQGRLFKAYKSNVSCVDNHWFSVNQFENWFAKNQNEFAVALIEKPHWLSLQYFDDSQFENWLTLSQVSSLVSGQKFAMPFVVKSKKHASQNKMVFIAPNQWPEIIQEK